MADHTPPSLPAISIVTPSFNRKEYLAETMDSVLGQGYPHLEYAVVDGQSTDGSAELIARRADDLAWWVSEPDGGPWEAINKGFARTSGEVMGWLGSDDLLMPWSLRLVGEIFATFPQIEWLTTLFPTMCDERGRPTESFYLEAYTADAFFRGENLPYAGWRAAGYIQQEGTFWRRSLWERAGGGLDESLPMGADFELWARFHRSGAKLYGLPVPLALFRVHANQGSADSQGYSQLAQEILRRYGGQPPTIRGVPVIRHVLVRILPQRLQRFAANAAAGLLSSPPPPRGLRVTHGGRGEGWRIEDQ